MQVIKTWNYLRGYVIIKVEGLTLERFLNLATTSDIYLWDIKRLDNLTLEVKVSIEGFKALKKIVKKVGCKVELVDKKGIPFILYRLKYRKMLGFGLIIFLSIILFLSSLIWSIDIIGNEQTSRDDITEILDREDIKTGRIKYKIDTDYLKRLLLNEFDNFSFLSVEIKGTKLIIEVKEQDLLPEKIEGDNPCNIVAGKKGVIVKTIAKNGKSVVQKGDIVNEGQTLITGKISDGYDEDLTSDEDLKEDIYVHAEGEVLAKTIYSYRLDESIVKTVEEETGEVYERSRIKIGEKEVQFSKGEIPFINYVEEVREVKLFGNSLDLPFKFLIYKYKEIELEEVKQNMEFLKQTAYIKAIEELNKQLPKDVEIVSKDVKYDIEGDVLYTQIIIEAIEDIGVKQIIDIN